MKTNQPDASEYAPFYEKYVSLVPDGDIVQILNWQFAETSALLASISAAQAASRYAEGKWSVKELIGHVIDSERVFGYRALRFARGDRTPLPGFDQDVFNEHASFDDYSVDELADEYGQVRRGHLSLFRHLDADAWMRAGEASGHPVSVRALAYIIAGHELHHLKILRERYAVSNGSKR